MCDRLARSTALPLSHGFPFSHSTISGPVCLSTLLASTRNTKLSPAIPQPGTDDTVVRASGRIDGGRDQSAICWSLALPDTAASINHKPSQSYGIGKLSSIFAYWILQRVNEDPNRVKQRRELHRYVGVRRRWPNVYMFPREIFSTRFIFGRCRRVSVAER